jgi:hypothetical protein
LLGGASLSLAAVTERDGLAGQLRNTTMDMPNTATVVAALDAIAAFFREDVTTVEGGTRNVLNYPQEKILNAICYGATNQIMYTEEQTLTEAKHELAKALADFQGNEISINQVQRKMSRVESTNYQLAHLNAFKDLACAAYLKHTGKAYEHRRTGKQPVSKDSLLAAAAALAGVAVPAGATDKASTEAVKDEARTARKRA